MKKLLFIAMALCLTKIGSAQLAVGYYPLPFSVVEVSSNPEQMIFGNIRLQTNAFPGIAFSDLAVNVNFKRTEVWNAYAIVGSRMSPFDINAYGTIIDGYYLGAGVRLKPFKEVRNLAITMELAPYVNEVFASGRFISNFGVSWHFRKDPD